MDGYGLPDKHREQIFLAVRCSTQTKADERISDAQLCRDLVGNLYAWFEPTESIRFFDKWNPCGFDGVIISGKQMPSGEIECQQCGKCWNDDAEQNDASHCDCGYRMDDMTIRFEYERNTQSLIDQCEAAGVNYEIVEGEP